jgi:hypothetical protein
MCYLWRYGKEFQKRKNSDIIGFLYNIKYRVVCTVKLSFSFQFDDEKERIAQNRSTVLPIQYKLCKRFLSYADSNVAYTSPVHGILEIVYM